MKIIHRNDLDGRTAAFLVKQAHKDLILKESDFLEVIPGQPWNLEAIKPFEPVYLLDIAPPDEETFRVLLKITPEVVWFTHHTDEIGRFPQPEFAGLRGTRMISQSTTYQVKTFFPQLPIQGNGLSWVNGCALGDPTTQTLWFGLGSEIRDTRPFADSNRFIHHLTQGNASIIAETIQDGKIIDLYRKSWEARGQLIVHYVMGVDAADHPYPTPEKKSPENNPNPDVNTEEKR